MVSTKNVTLGSIIVIFLGVITVLAILPAIGENTNELTNKFNVVQERIVFSNALLANGSVNASYPLNISHAPTGWKQTKCPISGFTITNSSNATATVTTHYTFNTTTGTLRLAANAANNIWNNSGVNKGNVSLANYTYCGDGYVANSAGRGIAGLILIFAGLAIVAFAIFYGISWLYRR